MTTMMAALIKANAVQQVKDYEKYIRQQYLGTPDKAGAKSLVFDNKQFEQEFTSKK
jgi:hypothetical protein